MASGEVTVQIILDHRSRDGIDALKLAAEIAEELSKDYPHDSRWKLLCKNIHKAVDNLIIEVVK